MSSYIDPLNPGASLGRGKSRLGQGVSGGRAGLRPSIINPLDPGASLAPARLPRLQTPRPGEQSSVAKIGAQGVTLPKDLAYQAKTGADVISTNSSLSIVQRKQAEDRLVAQFEAKNLPPEYLTALKDIIYQRRAYGDRQNRSTAQAINHVLGVVENTQAGFLGGTAAFQKQHGITSWKDQWKYLASPSLVYKEFAAGFKDIPSGVSNSKTFQQLGQETNKPGSLAYKYSMPIGLGMAVLFDPTTYVTFGASSSSKSAAYHVLAESDKVAWKGADDLMKANYGKEIQTIHGPVIANYHNRDLLFSHVKVQNHMPFTLGDALDQIHLEGLTAKQEIRQTGKFWDGTRGGLVDASPRQKLTARVLPNNVRGGRGVRIAGKQIPGTGALGAELGRRVRAPSEVTGSIGHDVGSALIPSWSARHVVDDGARASALVEMARHRTNISRMQTDIGRNVRDLQRPMVPIEDAAHIPHDPAFLKPTPEQLADQGNFFEHGRFASMYNKKTGEVITGGKGVDHKDLIDSLSVDAATKDSMRAGNGEWGQGTGIFDPQTGDIGTVNTASKHFGSAEEEAAAKEAMLKDANSKYKTQAEGLGGAISTPTEMVSHVKDELNVPLIEWDPAHLTNQEYNLGDDMFAVSAAYDPETGKVYTSTRDHTEIMDELGYALSPEEQLRLDQYTVIADRHGKIHAVNSKMSTMRDSGVAADSKVAKDIKAQIEAKFKKGAELTKVVGERITPRVEHYSPSPQELIEKPYLNYFRLWVNPKNHKDILAGAPGLDHHEFLDDWGIDPAEYKGWYQGTGRFDENGNISGVNVVRQGDDRFNPEHWSPEGTDEIGNKAEWFAETTPEDLKKDPWKQAFPVLYDPERDRFHIGAPGQGHDDIYENVPELMDDFEAGKSIKDHPLAGERGLVEGTGIINPDTGRVSRVNIFEKEVGEEGPTVAHGPVVDKLRTRALDQARAKYVEARQVVKGDAFTTPLPDHVSQAQLDADAAKASRIAYGHEPSWNDQPMLHEIASESPKFKRVLVKPEDRVGIMSADPSSLTSAQKIVRNNITADAEIYIKKAVDAGINEQEITRLWTHTLDYYPDPLLALAEFKFKAGARAAGADFTNMILTDPRFSIPLNTKTAVESILRKDVLEPGVDLGKLDEAPRGFTEFTHGNQRYAVRNSIIDGLREMTNPTRIDSSMQRGFRRLNIAQDYWKLYATSPNPAFHVMNFLGAAWNNALAGVYNPADYYDAMKVLYGGRKEEAAQVGAKFGAIPGLRRVPQSTEKGRAAQNLLSEAEARSGLGRSSFLFADVSRGHYTPEQLAMSDRPIAETASMFEKLAAQSMDTGKGFAKRQLTPAAGHGKLRTYGVTVPRKAAGVALAAHANPLAFAMFLPELANAGRKVGGTIEDLVRLAPFMKFSNDPAVRRVLAEYGPINSSMEIGWKGFTKADQQTMYDIGAHISRHFQFDYSDLTPFERYVAKSIFPFWVYYKKNLGLQIAQFAHKPVTFAVANRLMNFVNENPANQSMGPWQEILPSYFNNLNAFQVPVPNSVRDKIGLPHDQPMYLNPKMPFLSINLIPNLYDIVKNPNETSSQKMLETLAPLFGSVGPFAPVPLPGAKIMLEAGTGHNLGLNRPIDFQRASSNDLRQSYVPAPSWIKYLPEALQKGFFHASKNPKTGKLEVTATANYVLQQMSAPFINNLGQSIAVQGASEEEQGKAKANLVSWLTGVRLMPVDVLRLDRNAAYTLQDQLEAEQSELRSRGQQMSIEKQVMLARVKADLKVIEFAYDQRENPVKP